MKLPEALNKYRVEIDAEMRVVLAMTSAAPTAWCTAVLKAAP